MIEAKYPSLVQLFSCYFHQDWYEEFDTPDMAIEAFIEAEPSDVVMASKRELQTIISEQFDEPAVSAMISELGCFYDPAADNLANTEWLKTIEEKL